MSKSGIVNVRMVITEEKILSNIDKIQKMLNPNSKKQIIQLEEDSYFKDLITVAKSKKKGWRDEVKAAEDDLPEEIIEALNILGKSKSVKTEDYQDSLKLLNARVNNLESNLHIEIDMERIEDRSKALSYIGIEIADALKVIPTPVEEKKRAVVIEEEPVIERPVKPVRTEKVVKPAKHVKVVETVKPERVERTAKSEKVVKAERVEKTVRPERVVRAERAERPMRPEKVVRNERVARPIRTVREVEEFEEQDQLQAYKAETTFRRKHSLWQRIKDSKFMRAATYIFRIKIRIELPNALPEGRGENY